MTLLLVGGGSGGHIVPLLAVAHELKADDRTPRLIFVIEKGSQFRHLPEKSPDIDEQRTIRAGKFRRYHGQSLLAKILDMPTNLRNIRDLGYFVIGFFQSLYLVKRTKPQAVFIKGGFVGLPVGLACRILRVPYMTHDSDTVPGLTNRLIAGGAKAHAVGMPKEFYTYPSERTFFTGIPISANYQKVTKDLQKEYRAMLDIPQDATVLTVTGGSLGAVRLNKMIAPAVLQLVRENKQLYVLHQTGKKDSSNLYSELDDVTLSRVRTVSFSDELFVLTGAADVVVTRAGATTIAELAAQAKPTIVVPNDLLANGHQSANARHLKKAGAVVVMSEEAAVDKGVTIVQGLLQNKQKQKELAHTIHELARPTAAKELASLLINLSTHVQEK